LPGQEKPFLFEDDGPRWPISKPKDAASLILVQRGKHATRVLMGERHRNHAFLPGRVVFPGGRVDIGDLRVVVPTDLRPEIRSKVAVGSSPERARGLALAAVRETFEETGYLVGERKDARPGTRSAAWRRFFSQTLDFVARAITPPGRPRRFDARFFLADAEDIAQTLDPKEASGELLRPLWLTFAEARAAEILPITSCILDEVEARLADGPDPGRPVPFFIPRRGRAVIVSL
jgi:8-oxo-dGTP pyrophosphatase MutT (NUDIX family)